MSVVISVRLCMYNFSSVVLLALWISLDTCQNTVNIYQIQNCIRFFLCLKLDEIINDFLENMDLIHKCNFSKNECNILQLFRQLWGIPSTTVLCLIKLPVTLKKTHRFFYVSFQVINSSISSTFVLMCLTHLSTHTKKC